VCFDHLVPNATQLKADFAKLKKATNAMANDLAQPQKATAQTLRNRRRRARKRALLNSTSQSVLNYGQSGTNVGGPTNLGAITSRRMKTYAGALKSISPAGLNFIKCAFAPPDMQFDASSGVPDSTMARRLIKRHKLTVPLSFAAAQDTYILIIPVPGYAYFTASVAAGTPILANTVFSGVAYSDASTLLPSGVQATVVDRYRHLSNCVEIVPTANEMTWSGNMQVWKAPIDITWATVGTAGSDTGVLTVNGLGACNATNEDNFIVPFKGGIFSQAYKSAPTFEWKNLIPNQQVTVPEIFIGNDFGALRIAGAGSPQLYGTSAMESIIVKVSGVSAAESAILKTWACVEYQTVPGSIVYEYASSGPLRDQVALDLYDQIVRELPVAVCYTENDSMWERILRIISTLSGGLSVLPGPYGSLARGVNLVTNGLQTLTV
jgi:hypothetical protein